MYQKNRLPSEGLIFFYDYSISGRIQNRIRIQIKLERIHNNASINMNLVVREISLSSILIFGTMLFLYDLIKEAAIKRGSSLNGPALYPPHPLLARPLREGLFFAASLMIFSSLILFLVRIGYVGRSRGSKPSKRSN